MREVKTGYERGGEEPLGLIVGRLITVADAEATRLVTSQRNGELDAKEFREFVRSIGDLMELQKRNTLRGQGESSTSGEEDDAPVGGFAGKLLAEAEEEGGDDAQSPPPPTPISAARTSQGEAAASS